MIFTKAFILFALSLFFSFSARAQWKTESREIWQNQSSIYKNNLSNPVAATFWGGMRRLNSIPFNKGRIYPMAHRLLNNNTLPIYISEQDIKSDLVIFMPGIYGQADKSLSERMIRKLEEMGFHVLLSPNILAANYIRLLPIYDARFETISTRTKSSNKISKAVSNDTNYSPIDTEIALHNAALDLALQKLDGKYKKIHILAESLGTTTAAAWYAKDLVQQKRIDDVTLIWPPLDLFYAMKNFDQQIEAYRDYECSKFKYLGKIIYAMFFSSTPAAYSKEEQNCFGRFVLVDGFVDKTQEVFAEYAYAINNKLKYKTESSMGGLVNINPNYPISTIDPKFKPKNFEDFFKNYRPEIYQMIKDQSEDLKLQKWVKQILQQNSKANIKILSSKDDFLNKNLDWQDFLKQSGLSADHLLLLDWGGHSGPVGTDEFFQVLKLEYKMSSI